jgi:hypothetical protein
MRNHLNNVQPNCTRSARLTARLGRRVVVARPVLLVVGVRPRRRRIRQVLPQPLHLRLQRLVLLPRSRQLGRRHRGSLERTGLDCVGSCAGGC